MAKKLIQFLDFESEYDFLVLGIFCAYRDYKICFELNNVLELSFEMQDDFELQLEKKGSTGQFPIFLAENADEEQYFVIGNKGNNGLFIPELRQVDYFLLIRNQTRDNSTSELIEKIKSIEIVSSVIEISPKELKSGEHFMYIEKKVEKPKYIHD
ncbi:MAG: IPExxxVDY family protein [Bacteroidota bacterium]